MDDSGAGRESRVIIASAVSSVGRNLDQQGHDLLRHLIELAFQQEQNREQATSIHIAEQVYKRISANSQRTYNFFLVTSIIVFSILVGTALGTIIFAFMGQYVGSVIFGGVSVVDLLTGYIFRPHKQLMNANILIARLEQAWMQYMIGIEQCKASAEPELCMQGISNVFLGALKQVGMQDDV